MEVSNSKLNIVKKIAGDPLKNKAYGCIFAAMIGDFIGSQKGDKDDAKLKNAEDIASLMDYDNIVAKAPADSELSMCLIKALASMDAGFSNNVIAE